MKKVLSFVVTTKKGQTVFNTCCAMIFASLVIGIILSVPIAWMGHDYESTWMNSIAPYFFYAFFTYAAMVLFFFIPYLWYVGTSEKYSGDSRGAMKAMAIVCSLLPGALIYSPIREALSVSYGLHNLIGMFVFGIIYLWIMKIIFRKPFAVAQTFIPLT